MVVLFIRLKLGQLVCLDKMLLAPLGVYRCSLFLTLLCSLLALVLGRQTNFNFSTKSYVINVQIFAPSQDYLPLVKVSIEPNITYTY